MDKRVAQCGKVCGSQSCKDFAKLGHVFVLLTTTVKVEAAM